MAKESGQELFPERFPARGNLIISHIVLHPGEGLIINWVRDDIMPTMIDETGVNKPLYDLVRELFPDTNKVAGKGLFVASTESGLPIELGEIGGGGKRVSIEKELKEIGLLD